MPEIVEIELLNLLFDTQNARYADEPASQQAAALQLAEKHADHIPNLRPTSWSTASTRSRPGG